MGCCEEKTTTMLLDDGYGAYSITVPGSDMDVPDLYDGLIRPLLLAAGYTEKSVDNYFRRE